MRLALIAVLAGSAFAQTLEWTNYGGDPGGSRYSTAKSINPANVTKLKQAWIYHTGALIVQENRNRRLRLKRLRSLLTERCI